MMKKSEIIKTDKGFVNKVPILDLLGGNLNSLGGRNQIEWGKCDEKMKTRARLPLFPESDLFSLSWHLLSLFATFNLINFCYNSIVLMF